MRFDPAQELYDSYAASAIPVLRVSAATGEGLPELRRAMKGKLNALTGNSGVGKSSILNAMEPVFGLLTVLAVGSVQALMPWLLSFAAGAMLYVVVEELIPEANLSQGGHSGTLGVMTGFLMMMILDVALG